MTHSFSVTEKKAANTTRSKTLGQAQMQSKASVVRQQNQNGIRYQNQKQQRLLPFVDLTSWTLVWGQNAEHQMAKTPNQSQIEGKEHKPDMAISLHGFQENRKVKRKRVLTKAKKIKADYVNEHKNSKIPIQFSVKMRTVTRRTFKEATSSSSKGRGIKSHASFKAQNYCYFNIKIFPKRSAKFSN